MLGVSRSAAKAGVFVRHRLLPGDRIVWLAAGVAALIAGAGVGKFLIRQSVPLTGTNSVDIGAVVARPHAGDQTCIYNLTLPKGTGRVQIWAGLQRVTSLRPRLAGSLVAASGYRLRLHSDLGASSSGAFRDITIRPLLKSVAAARFCFRATGAALDLGGAAVNKFPGTKNSTVQGRSISGEDIAVRYLFPSGTHQRLWSRIIPAFARASLFKHLPGGEATVWLVLLLLGLLAPYLAVLTTATLERLSTRQIAWRAAGLAAIGGVAWAVMLPPLHGADESEHFAYVQHVAETGHRAEASPTARQPYSSDQLLLMGAIRHSSSVLNNSSRVSWDEGAERAYDRALAHRPSRADGGGYTESASGHSPLYYGLLAAPYRLLGQDAQTVNVLVLLRVCNALAAALVAALAVYCGARVAPTKAWVGWSAGLLVATQPVFASVAGTINNDTLVNVAAAAAVTLLITALQRGITLKLAVLLGLATAVLPLAKVTGFAIWPVIGLGLFVLVLKEPKRHVLTRVLMIPAVAAVLLGIWIFVGSQAFGSARGTLLNLHPSAGLGATAIPGDAAPSHLDHLNYLLQMIVPFVKIGRDVWSQPWPLYSIYIERGYGRFGWLDAGLPSAALLSVLVALCAGWIAAIGVAWSRRTAWRQWGPAALIMVSTIAGVITFVAVAYAATSPRPVPSEQGRYFFPALVPASVLIACGLDILPLRLRPVVSGCAAVFLPVFAAYAWFAALAGYYT